MLFFNGLRNGDRVVFTAEGAQHVGDARPGIVVTPYAGCQVVDVRHDDGRYTGNVFAWWLRRTRSRGKEMRRRKTYIHFTSTPEMLKHVRDATKHASVVIRGPLKASNYELIDGADGSEIACYIGGAWIFPDGRRFSDWEVEIN